MSARKMSAMRPVTEYVVKVASRCDLACDHCYVYDDPEQGWLRQPRRMDPAVVRLVAARIAEHAVGHGLDRVVVILHGGEPLLLGEARLTAILSELRSTIGQVVELDLRLQSNGTLLTARMCEVLVRHSAKIGISLDGDRQANDRHRRYAHGGSSYARAQRGLSLLRRPEFRASYGGILCTIDVDNDPLRVFEALLREAPPRIDFLLPHATWDTPPPGRGYAEWLLRIYDRWQADGRSTPVRLFESIRALERGGVSGTESLGPITPTVAVVETDGTWEMPDSLKVVSGDAPSTGLDLRQHSADDFLRHVGSSRHRLDATPTACTTCPIVTTCGGGLYAHRFSGGGYDNPSVYCADLARLILGIRYRQRVAARSYTTRTAAGAVGRLVEEGADLAMPEVLDGLLRCEFEADHELMFVVATLAGQVHGQAAWQLLTEVEAASPESVRATLGHPYLRQRLLDAVTTAVPAAEGTCRGLLAAVAMSAAVEAGYPATLDVPVDHGLLCLPGVGVLALPGASVARVSSSRRSAAFVARSDDGSSVAVDGSGSTETWWPVSVVEVDGVRLRLDDVGPFRDCHADPVAARLAPADRQQWISTLKQAWTLVRVAAPALAAIMDTVITTVTPLTPLPSRCRCSSGASGGVPGAVVVPSAGPVPTAVVLVEHAARAAVLMAHRVLALTDDHRPADPAPTPLVNALADVYAELAALRLAEGRKRHGEPVAEAWVAERKDRLDRRHGELSHSDHWTKTGRMLLDRVGGALADGADV